MIMREMNDTRIGPVETLLEGRITRGKVESPIASVNHLSSTERP